MGSGGSGESLPATHNVFSEAGSSNSFNIGQQPQTDFEKEMTKEASPSEAVMENTRPPATVGPCLAKLDPAVAQASQQRFLVCISLLRYLGLFLFVFFTFQPFNPPCQDLLNFSNIFSPMRKQNNNVGRAMYGLDSMSLEKVAKLHRNSAGKLAIFQNKSSTKKLNRLRLAYYDATCTWRGQLPTRSHNNKILSVKVFLGGVPWDISEQNLIQAFRPFGNIRIEWPGKETTSCVPKGYLYLIFEHEKQVKCY